MDNERGIATGWLPGELSARGRELAKQLGVRRRGTTDVVFTSDLRRAVETAEIAFEGTGIPVIKDARLRECNYGSLNGAPVACLDEVRSKYIDVPFPDGQSYQDVVDQTTAFLTDLADGYGGKHVLVIAHSANRWALQVLLDGHRLQDLLATPFDWQPGWSFTVPAGWTPVS